MSIAAAVLLLFLFIGGCSTCTLVGPKEAGFKVKRGGTYRGVQNIPLITGYNFYLPWYETVEKVPTTMYHIVWTDDKNEGDKIDQSITINCNGGAGFHVNVGLNVSVIATEAPRMWIRWGTLDVDFIMKTYIRNTVRGQMQRVSSSMSVDSVLNNFSHLETACSDAIRDSLLVYGFAMNGFNILSKPVATDPALEAAINAKIVAKQNAEKTIMENQTAIAEANKVISKARGDSAAQVIEAAGKAEAIKVLQAQISPTYVEYVKWTKWDGVLPGVVGGSGGMMLQLPTNKKE